MFKEQPRQERPAGPEAEKNKHQHTAYKLVVAGHITWKRFGTTAWASLPREEEDEEARVDEDDEVRLLCGRVRAVLLARAFPNPETGNTANESDRIYDARVSQKNVRNTAVMGDMAPYDRHCDRVFSRSHPSS